MELSIDEKKLIIKSLNLLEKTNEVKTLIDKFNPKEINLVTMQIETKLKELGFKECINNNPDTKSWGKNTFNKVLYKGDIIYIPDKNFILRMNDKYGYLIESLNDLIITLKEYSNIN